MTELIVVLLICVAWGIISIIIKLIERRCKHEWDSVQELPVYGDNGDIPIAYLYREDCKPTFARDIEDRGRRIEPQCSLRCE